MARLAAPPDPTGADPVRGPLTLKTVHDLRPGRRVISTIVGDQRIDRALGDDDAEKTVWLRRAGWTVAGTIALTLFILRIRRPGKVV